ncbi:M28 family peptidase [Campylobacter sp. 19-13652]|uniref:M28 family peptidase n=1 Tax=Campylobacter sp. 19-13652 TaxID=2840180 RepID=UPI001C754436|nr:M28 family peptidase [Campylobacter sp. 19-13652]BCX79653.1 peptidase [Campylobacter sp. 19-13652]
MSASIEHFKRIASIPHCSFDTARLRDFLVDFCRDKGCEIGVDELGNIHAIKGSPKLCLQSHYDMVCIGDAPNLELVFSDDGFLRAKNSSLGADNGMGVAMMMQMLSEFDNLECLFTNDEEVGLIGANGFKGELKSSYLLNLDSESDDEVIVGCAGGVNVFASVPARFVNGVKGECYEVVVSGLAGGHSGIDIHKNIPNAIKVLGEFVAKNDGVLCEINGGERSNSIPVAARAVAIFKTAPKKCENVSVKKLEAEYKSLEYSAQILALINSFAQGVRSFDVDLKMPIDSINLSLIKQENGVVELEFFARSMSWEGLHRLEFETVSLAHALGFNTTSKDRSVPWKPEVGSFSADVLKYLQGFNKNAKIAAVHAGLEAGVIKDTQSGIKEACSIGPNIYSPHSVSERCELASVDRIESVLREIVRAYQ